MSAEAKQGYYELIEPRTLFNSIIPVLLGMMYTEYNFQFLFLHMYYLFYQIALL